MVKIFLFKVFLGSYFRITVITLCESCNLIVSLISLIFVLVAKLLFSGGTQLTLIWTVQLLYF